MSIQNIINKLKKLEQYDLAKELLLTVGSPRLRKDARNEVKHYARRIAEHCALLLALPNNLSRKHWLGELSGYLFNIRLSNKNQKGGKPWLTEEELQKEANEYLKDQVVEIVERKLKQEKEEGMSSGDIAKVRKLVKDVKNLSQLGFRFKYLGKELGLVNKKGVLVVK